MGCRAIIIIIIIIIILPDLNLLGLPFIVPLEANEDSSDLLKTKQKTLIMDIPEHLAHAHYFVASYYVNHYR
jgi:hypothetical protein